MLVNKRRNLLAYLRGKDEQLETCIAYLVKKIAEIPMTIPETPQRLIS